MEMVSTMFRTLAYGGMAPMSSSTASVVIAAFARDASGSLVEVKGSVKGLIVYSSAARFTHFDRRPPINSSEERRVRDKLCI